MKDANVCGSALDAGKSERRLSPAVKKVRTSVRTFNCVSRFTASLNGPSIDLHLELTSAPQPLNDLTVLRLFPIVNECITCGRSAGGMRNDK